MFAKFRRRSAGHSLTPASAGDQEASRSKESIESYETGKIASNVSPSGRFRLHRSRDTTLTTVDTLVDDDSSRERPHTLRSKSTSAESKAPDTGGGDFSSRTNSSHASGYEIRTTASSLNPLGLHVAYAPPSLPSVDLIFVHGLGGTSQASWSWQRDVAHFWPGKWLPKEDSINTARILSFGYDAHFKSGSSGVVSSISDFAKDLLFCMKFGTTEDAEQLHLGKRPIIIIAHSMGGLIAKKACVLGQNDPHYEEIILSVQAILFLGTPHRGSNLAESLNRILSISPMNSTKQYISDLHKSSAALEDLNEQFRNFASQVQLFSFYETLLTPLGPTSKLIVDKNSSILGYSNEISKPLYTNHHELCKYASPKDENYASVRNTLSAVIAQLQTDDQHFAKDARLKELQAIKEFLSSGKLPLPQDDQEFFYKRKAPDTCEWIMSHPSFVQWANDDLPSSRILWLNAKPGSGKSTLASYVVNWLNQRGEVCPYFFFRFGDQNKRSLNTMLKVIALQIAEAVPAYRQRLVHLPEVSTGLDNVDARTLWQKLFNPALFLAQDCPRLFWIIDGLDECESARTLLDFLSSIPMSKGGIRVLATSRPNSGLSMKMDSLSTNLSISRIDLEQNTTDFATYARAMLDPVPWPVALREHVVEEVLRRAQGSFLWVHFAVSEIAKCHTPTAIDEVLQELPSGMESLYKSMEADLFKNIRSADRDLAKKILRWATCSRLPLTLEQLQYALTPEFMSLLDPRYTVGQLCGQFIVIDDKERLTMLHQTARDYLLKSPISQLSLNASDSHAYLLERCLLVQLQHKGTSVMNEGAEAKFLSYATLSWPYHLKSSSASSDNVLNVIVDFLNNQGVLHWIQALASLRELKTMVYASKVLTDYVKRRRKVDADKMPLLHRLEDRDTIEVWATDLIRIMGKFSPVLLDEPSSIYKTIPPFCPRESAIFRLAGIDTSPLALTIKGFSDSNWDDCLAKVSMGQEVRALRIKSTTKYFAIATSRLEITLWDTQSLELVHTLCHSEHIAAMTFNQRGDQFASFGFKTTRVWNTLTGKQLHSVSNPARGRALALCYSPDDRCLLAGSIDRRLRKLVLSEAEAGWRTMEFSDQLDEHSLYGSHRNSPGCISFSPDASMVAIGYRGAPLSVWHVEPARMVNQCLQDGGYHQKETKAWLGVDRVQWHPTAGEIIGIFANGSIFKWHPYRNELHQIQTASSEIECSAEGTMFVTSDSQGTIRLYDYGSFSLVYRLCYDRPVVSLSISPDCQRLYDLRGSSCNIWEPNALVRLSDKELAGSETNSELEGSVTTRGVSEAWSEQVEKITALASEPDSEAVAVGNEAGVVSLYYPDAEEKIELWSSQSSMAIETLNFSGDGKYLASADLSGTVIVHELVPGRQKRDQTDSLAPRKLLAQGYASQVGSLRQLLFDTSALSLLICGREGATLRSFTTHSDTKLERTHQSNVSGSCRYINHPTNDDQFLEFDYSGVSVWRWDHLSPVARIPYEEIPMILEDPQEQSDRTGQSTGSHGELLRVTVSNDCRTIVLFFSHASGATQRNVNDDGSYVPQECIRVIRTSSISNGGPLTLVTIPKVIVERITLPLGIVSKDRLVFLDSKNWVCTWQIEGAKPPSSDVRRHFFLPRDWIGPDELRLCTLAQDGSLIYPRHGRVAVVKSNRAMGNWGF
ncbi:MAG: hypothetical protein M4579_007119 [Chaenotheca gracillima]|nr:MAG: hypothetical protein M4579_007119 [Chaenotheca gracillima]